jgi:hypothetical protein
MSLPFRMTSWRRMPPDEGEYFTRERAERDQPGSRRVAIPPSTPSTVPVVEPESGLAR